MPVPPSRAQRWARAALARRGWSVEITPPPVPRGVVIVYPHTSNWDFVVGYLAKTAAALPVAWMGKDTLFRWPFGALLRCMGGIPVNRREPTGLIARLAAQLATRDRIWLAIAPEGTRARTDRWHSGFYHLALAARVPVGLAFIDYRRRRVVLRRYLTLTGDEEADLDRIRAEYAGAVGRHPEQAGAIRLRAPAKR